MLNYLEQLATEWYQFQRYWVYANVRVSQLGLSGKSEIDVIALHLERRELVHAELSSGAFDAKEISRYEDKFAAVNSEVLERLFPGAPLPTTHKRIAIWEYVPRKITWDTSSFQILRLPQFCSQINDELQKYDYYKKSVPESYPILRTMLLDQWLAKQSMRAGDAD